MITTKKPRKTKEKDLKRSREWHAEHNKLAKQTLETEKRRHKMFLSVLKTLSTVRMSGLTR
jgi:hypothetical protein